MLLEDSPAVLSHGFPCEDMGYPCELKRESPSLIRGGKLIRCKSENHVPIVAVSKGLRIPDDPSKALGDRLQIPGVRSSGDQSRQVLQSDVPCQEKPGSQRLPRAAQKHEESAIIIHENRKSPNERRFGKPFDGPIVPFGADFLQTLRKTEAWLSMPSYSPIKTRKMKCLCRCQQGANDTTSSDKRTASTTASEDIALNKLQLFQPPSHM